MPIRTDEVMIVKGRWTQVGFSFRTSKKFKSAVFLCECGNRKVVKVGSVVAGESLSCGCLCVEINDAQRTKHGHSRNGRKSSEYISWSRMKQRCYNETHAMWPEYGSRGISVCERWRDSFEAFLEDMGPRPDGCSIDRIDNDGDYEPRNCRWSNSHDQSRNKRSNIMIEVNGVTKCITDWSASCGAAVSTIKYRLKRGWSAERAVTEPGREKQKESKQ